jgi:hypothetical protein
LRTQDLKNSAKPTVFRKNFPHLSLIKKMV